MSETGELVQDVSPPADEEPVAPLGLRVVAFLFILTGVLSATDIVLSMVKGGLVLNLNPGVLGIFIGRGILRRSEWWRSCGAFCLFLVLGMIALGLILCGVFKVFPPGGGHVEFPSFGSLCAIVVIAAIAFWAFRTTRSPTTRQWCSEPYVPTRRPFQFTLSTMLLAMVVCSFVFAKISTDEDLIYLPRQQASCSRLHTGGKTCLTYSHRSYRFSNKPARLEYAVFSSNTKGTAGKNGMGMSTSGQYWIIVDDMRIDMPNACQLHEIIDGRHATSDRRVTLEELEAYLASNPPRYTLQSLLDFADTRRHEGRGAGAGSR
ncbi:MAG TPA: hypothetical protein VJL29_10645 [Thermoguttaceae bacterium]|nr:hypothetical protein [Thermoguttaceae bacterium]